MFFFYSFPNNIRVKKLEQCCLRTNFNDIVINFRNYHLYFSWLKSKRKDDAVEDDLWRINDTLYDFTDFVHKHPGGSDWISVTKGLDITEAVETHHIYPEKLEIYLKKYRVRETTKPRNSKLTFKEDGFYVTMRKKVAAKLPHIVKTTPKLLSKVIFIIDFNVG